MSPPSRRPRRGPPRLGRGYSYQPSWLARHPGREPLPPWCRVNGKTYESLVDTPCKGWSELHAWVFSWGVASSWPMGIRLRGEARRADPADAERPVRPCSGPREPPHGPRLPAGLPGLLESPYQSPGTRTSSASTTSPRTRHGKGTWGTPARPRSGLRAPPHGRSSRSPEADRKSTASPFGSGRKGILLCILALLTEGSWWVTVVEVRRSKRIGESHEATVHRERPEHER